MKPRQIRHVMLAFVLSAIISVAGLTDNRPVLAALIRHSATAGLSLTFSTYVSQSRDNQGLGIATDTAGNTYLATSDGPSSGAVTEFSASGNHALYRHTLPGSIMAIAVDSAGNAYVTGQTYSATFPAVHAIQSTASGAPDAFVAKLDRAGKLVYSTYLGGGAFDVGTAIAVDRSGDAYIGGYTYSSNFPLRHPMQALMGSAGEGATHASDGFVSKLSPSGSLIYSTFLGGAQNDEVLGIALDGHQNAYVTGATTSSDFPVAKPLQRTLKGRFDAFVAKLNAAGSRLVFSTYLGGSGDDSATGIALAGTSVSVAGVTDSRDFPTVHPLQKSRGGDDAFIARLDTGGKHLAFSSYVGGTGTDQANAIASDRAGHVYVAGFTNSPDFPVAHPFQRSLSPGACDEEESQRTCYDAFLTELGPSGRLVTSTYLGGSGDDVAHGLVIGPGGRLTLAGTTSSSNFPIVHASHTGSPAHGTSTAFVAALGVGR